MRLTLPLALVCTGLIAYVAADLRPPQDNSEAARLRLWDAIKSNKPETVSDILSEGQQLAYATDPDTGDTPLHAAVKAKPLLGFIGSTIDMVERIHEYTHDATMQKNNDGNTPVHLAVMGGNPDIVAMLITNDIGISTDAGEEACFMKNKNRQTPLELAKEMRDRSIFFAARMGKMVELITAAQKKEQNEHRQFQEEAVKQLLDNEKISDQTITALDNLVSKDPLKYTRCHGRESILHMVLNKYFMLEFLKGTQLEQSSESSQCLLNFAKELMKKYPDILILQNQYGETVLHRAIKHHSATVVEEILKYPQGRISLILKNTRQNTPIIHQIQSLLDDEEKRANENDSNIQKINMLLKEAYKQLKQEQQDQ